MGLEESTEQAEQMQLDAQTRSLGLSAGVADAADVVTPTRLPQVLGGVLWALLAAVVIWVGQL